MKVCIRLTVTVATLLLVGCHSTGAGESSNASAIEQNNAGAAELNSGNVQGALADFNSALAADPGFGMALHNRALCYEKLERYTEAINDFTAALATGYYPFACHLNRGMCYDTMKAYDEAWNDELAAEQDDSSDGRPAFNMGVILIHRHKYEEAKAEFMRAVSKGLAAGQKAYDKLVQADADMKKDEEIAAAEFVTEHVDPVEKEGETAMAANDFAAAEKSFGEAIRSIGIVLKEGGPSVKDRACHLYLRRAAARAGLRNFEAAIADYNDALPLTDNPALVFVNRGRSFELARKYDDAIADFTRALESSPEWSVALTWRGQARMETRDYDRAVADLTKALDVNTGWDPESPESCRRCRGSAHARKEEFTDAVEDFKWVLGKQGATAFLLAETHADLGWVWFDQGKFDMAESEFDKAVQGQPNFPDPLVGRALSRLRLRKNVEAGKDYSAAAKLNPVFSGKDEEILAAGFYYSKVELEAMAELRKGKVRK